MLAPKPQVYRHTPHTPVSLPGPSRTSILLLFRLMHSSCRCVAWRSVSTRPVPSPVRTVQVHHTAGVRQQNPRPLTPHPHARIARPSNPIVMLYHMRSEYLAARCNTPGGGGACRGGRGGLPPKISGTTLPLPLPPHAPPCPVERPQVAPQLVPFYAPKTAVPNGRTAS